MSSFKRWARLLTPALAAVLSAAALLPAGAAARATAQPATTAGTYGYTSLVLNPGTAAALTQLGITPGVIAPAWATSTGAIDFPITDRLIGAVLTTTIRHSGGLSLTKGATTVDLTDFNINLLGLDLTAVVNGGSRVPILNLSFAGAKLGLHAGDLSIGPVTGTLTATAASALDSAFGTTALTAGLTLGQATVNYTF